MRTDSEFAVGGLVACCLHRQSSIYIDRQSLSFLAPFLKLEFMTNSDYANLLIGFRVAYSLGQAIAGG